MRNDGKTGSQADPRSRWEIFCNDIRLGASAASSTATVLFQLEVDRVLAQTRGLQKEINALSGKLERTFAETDELLFRDARKDETVRKAYKLLASLHANCELLVATEEERGALLRETRELEEQADGQKRRTREDQVETVVRDCEEMREMNEQLKKTLKTRLKAQDR